MPARIDDPRVRKDHEDESDVAPIVRLLVDEEGLAGLAVGAGSPEIFLPKVLQRLRLERREQLRIGEVGEFGIAGQSLASQRRDVGQLGRALYLRMA